MEEAGFKDDFATRISPLDLAFSRFIPLSFNNPGGSYPLSLIGVFWIWYTNGTLMVALLDIGVIAIAVEKR